MQLLELFLQGVPGFPPTVRLPVGGRHVAVRADVPLVPLLEAALYGGAGMAGRVGVLLRCAEAGTFRLVRDLPGGLRVQRLDESARRFVDAGAGADVEGFLRTQLGVPPRAAFRELLAFPPPALAQPAAAPVPAGSSADAEQAIARLEDELRLADRIDALQRRLDDLAHEQSGLQREGDALAAATGRVTRAHAALAGFDVLDDLPDDPQPLLERWNAAGAERNAALQRIAGERAAFDERLEEGTPAPLWKDLRFVASLAIGVAALGVGLFTELHIVALLNVPAFGAAAALGVRWVGRLQAVDSASRMTALFAERERKVEAAWETATDALRAAMIRAGVQTPAALADAVGARTQAKAELAAAEAELAAAQERHAPMASRLEALQSESAALESEMAALAAGAWRPRALVEAELAALRGGGGPVLAAAIPGALLQKPAGPDAARRMLDLAAELLGTGADGLAGRVTPRVGAYLAALTDERWRAVELSAAVGLRCEGLVWTELLDHDRTLALLALQFALVEAVGAKLRLPVIYDEPFGFLDTPHQQQLGQMLNALGRHVQVVHRTDAEAMLACADTVAEAA